MNRVCDLETSLARITRAAKQLQERWELTSEHWRDSASAGFEAQHLQPLTPPLTLALAALHQFADVLRQAERECADPEQRT